MRTAAVRVRNKKWWQIPTKGNIHVREPGAWMAALELEGQVDFLGFHFQNVLLAQPTFLSQP